MNNFLIIFLLLLFIPAKGYDSKRGGRFSPAILGLLSRPVFLC